jgi:hypothetical protein
VPAAQGQISRKARHQAASEDWGHSRCRRQPVSTQTRRQSQHHSEDYCEGEVDEVEWHGGRVYLHLGARRDDPPRGQADQGQGEQGPVVAPQVVRGSLEPVGAAVDGRRDDVGQEVIVG